MSQLDTRLDKILHEIEIDEDEQLFGNIPQNNDIF